MKILLHGLNYSPEQIGIGKYSGEMMEELAESQHVAVVVTAPPYYPQWKIAKGFKKRWYSTEFEGKGFVKVVRCPIWVPSRASGLKRILHLASFGLSSVPVVLWQAFRLRPDVIMTVEPAAFCMPTTLFAARLFGAKTWLHVQDFEVDAAFELGIIKQNLLKRIVLAVEGFLMRRFDRASSISPNMLLKLFQKGVPEERIVSFPNWVDCDLMQPLASPAADIPAIQWKKQLRDRFGIPASKCVAMYAGNIGAKQGLEIVVEAAKCHVENKHLHFVICGQGAAAESLFEAAEGLANVQFLPVQPMERFNELLNCADIHLLPQRADAADLVMPSKLTGMLATGRPVVAGAGPGTQIASIVEQRGIVVPPEDVDAFAAAIDCLAKDEDMRCEMGARARTYAEENLSRTSILAEFMRDLSELCYPEAGLRLVGGMPFDDLRVDPSERLSIPSENQDSSKPTAHH